VCHILESFRQDEFAAAQIEHSSPLPSVSDKSDKLAGADKLQFLKSMLNFQSIMFT
jgi:hypothetical protein